MQLEQISNICSSDCPILIESKDRRIDLSFFDQINPNPNLVFFSNFLKFFIYFSFAVFIIILLISFSISISKFLKKQKGIFYNISLIIISLIGFLLSGVDLFLINFSTVPIEWITYTIFMSLRSFGL